MGESGDRYARGDRVNRLALAMEINFILAFACILEIFIGSLLDLSWNWNLMPSAFFNSNTQPSFAK